MNLDLGGGFVIKKNVFRWSNSFSVLISFFMEAASILCTKEALYMFRAVIALNDFCCQTDARKFGRG